MSFLVGDKLTGDVIDLTTRAEGVVRIDNFPVFVSGALPGEKVIFEVTNIRKNFAEGVALEIIEESPHRTKALSDMELESGIMPLGHLSYDKQLEYKKEQVVRAFRKNAGLSDIEIRDTLASEKIWHYRNKGQIPVQEINGVLETGFYRRGSHDLIPTEDFKIQNKEIDKAVVIVRNIMRKYDIKAYCEETRSGLLRHIIVRHGERTNELMVILVLNKEGKLPKEEVIIEEIVENLPNMVSLYVNYQTKNTNVILGRKSRLLWGKEYYVDSLLDLDFKISPTSFFQVNTSQAEVLYEEALKAAKLTGEEVVLDAYCGIGSITLALAKASKEVYAMEIVEPAVDMARKNASLNGIDNVTFEVGKAEDWLPKWNKKGLKFDVICVDPPRKGLDKVFVEAAIKQDPKRIVYVSCNPATCARDVKYFVEASYKVEYVQPVDMFPQTTSIECVVSLSK